MKCPGCGTLIREREFDGRSLIVEIGSGARDSERSEHTPDRCRTTSGVARLIEAARDALAQGDVQDNGWWLVPGECMDTLSAALAEVAP